MKFPHQAQTEFSLFLHTKQNNNLIRFKAEFNKTVLHCYNNVSYFLFVDFFSFVFCF